MEPTCQLANWQHLAAAQGTRVPQRRQPCRPFRRSASRPRSITLFCRGCSRSLGTRQTGQLPAARQSAGFPARGRWGCSEGRAVTAPRRRWRYFPAGGRGLRRGRRRWRRPLGTQPVLGSSQRPRRRHGSRRQRASMSQRSIDVVIRSRRNARLPPLGRPQSLRQMPRTDKGSAKDLVGHTTCFQSSSKLDRLFSSQVFQHFEAGTMQLCAILSAHVD